MKRFVAIIFLFAVLLQSLSSLYLCLSFYLNRDYIAKNICVNRFDRMPVCKGQCYLAKVMSEQEKQEKKFPDLKQKEIQFFSEEAPLLTTSVILETLTAKTPIPGSPSYSSNFYASVFHPPQLC